MRKSTLTEAERIERRKQSRIKYAQSEKGKAAQAKSVKKYQQGERYREYKRKYYQDHKLLNNEYEDINYSSMSNYRNYIEIAKN